MYKNFTQTSFYFLLFANSALAMDIAFWKKENPSLIAAKDFIEKFPLMTFNDAKTEFNKLDTKTIQPIVWEKIEHIKNDPNKTLKCALLMTFLPEELQYRILSGDFNVPTNLKTIINRKSIYGHFRWRAIVDTRLNGEKNLTLSYPLYKSIATYAISESELFKKGDLMTINDFPESMQNDLIHYYRYSFAPSDNAKQILQTIPSHTLQRIHVLYAQWANRGFISDDRSFRYSSKTIEELTKDNYIFLSSLHKKNPNLFNLFFNSDTSNSIYSGDRIKDKEFFIRYQRKCPLFKKIFYAGCISSSIAFFFGLKIAAITAPLANLLAYLLPIWIDGNTIKIGQYTEYKSEITIKEIINWCSKEDIIFI